MTGRYVAQRGEFDCAVAALAMACDVTYESISAGLVTLDGCAISMEEAIKPDGGNDTIVKAWLRNNGWAWQEITNQIWMNKSFHPVHPWPPKPFALTHICFVEATKNWHYCVLDFDGSVRDPWNKERHSLDHPDYKRVASVLGLFKVGRNRSMAA